MEEEIDIIELLKRVKEGKEPKVIAINGDKYNYFKDWITLDEIYYTRAHGEEENLCYWEIDFMTKIKILDKPIINTVDELKKIIKDKDSIFWIGERGLMAIEEAINIIQSKEGK